MFAYPALLLCLIFSSWLLARDRRYSTSVSPMLWLPTLALLIIASRPLSSWLAGGQLREGEGAALSDQIFYATVLSASFIIATSRGIRWGKFLARNLPLMALYLFFAISILWSGDPTGSTKRLIKDFGLLFIISVILTETNPVEAVRTVYYRCACVLLPLSMLFIKYFPVFGRGFSLSGEQMFSGVTTQKNTLGESILVLSLVLLFDYLEKRQASSLRSRIPWDNVLLLSMSVLLLQVSKSRTALVCLLLGSALILRRGRMASKRINQLILVGALALPVIVLLTQTSGSLFSGVVTSLGRDMTFTGRTNIWAHITLSSVDPLRGAGYWNFWGGPGGQAISEAMNTPVPNAHNGYLDIYLDGGLIGVGLLCFILIVYGFRLAAKASENPFDRLRFAMLIAVIVYNLSESTYARLMPSWFTTLLLIVQFPYPEKSAKPTETEIELSSCYGSEVV